MAFWRRLRHQVNYGLLTQSILLRLARIGFDLVPYILYRENIQRGTTLKRDKQLRFEGISNEAVDDIASNFPDDKRIWPKTWRRRLSDGESGLLARHNDELAGFCWANQRFCLRPSGQRLFTLQDDESYLHDMVVAKKFRGMKLAPVLREAQFDDLLTQNRVNGFSISAYFNKPARRFKKKLDATPIELRCEVTLFRKLQYDFRLSRYDKTLSKKCQNRM